VFSTLLAPSGSETCLRCRKLLTFDQLSLFVVQPSSADIASPSVRSSPAFLMMDISGLENKSGGRDSATVSPRTIPTTPRRSWDAQVALEPEDSVTAPPPSPISTSTATATNHHSLLHAHTPSFPPRPSLSQQPATAPTATPVARRLSALSTLDPRPLEDLYQERSYLIHSLHRQSERATALLRYATLQSRAEQTRRARKEAAQLKSKIAESTQQEQLILLRLGEIWLELRGRERWAVAQEQLCIQPERGPAGMEGGGGRKKKGKKEIPSPLKLDFSKESMISGAASVSNSGGDVGSVLSPLSPCFVPRGSFSGAGLGSVPHRSVSGLRPRFGSMSGLGYGFESASSGLGYGHGSEYSPGLESGYESGHGPGSVLGSGHGYGYSPASLEGEIWGREALSREVGVGVSIGRGAPLSSPLSQGFVSVGDEQAQAQNASTTLSGPGAGLGPTSAVGNVIFADVLWEYTSRDKTSSAGATQKGKEKERPKSWSWYQRYVHGHGPGTRQSLSPSSVVQTPFPLKARDKRMSLPSLKTIWPRVKGVPEE